MVRRGATAPLASTQTSSANTSDLGDLPSVTQTLASSVLASTSAMSGQDSSEPSSSGQTSQPVAPTAGGGATADQDLAVAGASASGLYMYVSSHAARHMKHLASD